MDNDRLSASLFIVGLLSLSANAVEMGEYSVTTDVVEGVLTTPVAKSRAVRRSNPVDLIVFVRRAMPRLWLCHVGELPVLHRVTQCSRFRRPEIIVSSTGRRTGYTVGGFMIYLSKE